MVSCVYCRASSDAQFPKEHVVPEAFGRFYDNLTLASVCGACNTFFNRNLELFLARDSVEALLRGRYGLKAKSGKRNLTRPPHDPRNLPGGLVRRPCRSREERAR